ncbi:MAG: hypothetical protein HKN40_09125 [Winogradskyella sp.]|uniref:hypothetical protein n=1 Tax=Winogradskyella sp. TaxID=1883156 RepID=UPI00180FC434|nr:hypothetical protein [Winogradskyella sp.]
MRLITNIPDKHVFHSCILSTYTFDYNLFEYKIKPELQQKGITNIIVLCDANNDYSDLIALKNLDYALIPINKKGIFHPKLHIYIGRKNLMMHLGSGNLTISGLGYNHELFTTLACDNINDPQFSIIQNGLNYLLAFLKKKKGTVTNRIKWLKEYSDLIVDFNDPLVSVTQELNKSIKLSLLFNDNMGIYQKLGKLIPLNEVREIDILSPYWDNKPVLLNKLLFDFPNAIINVFVNGIKSQAPIESNQRIKYINFNETNRAKQIEKNNHSKIFIFHTNDRQYLIHGSANATCAGLGIGDFKNEEISLMYDTEDDLAKTIGLIPKITLDVKDLKIIYPKTSPIKSEATKRLLIDLNGADRTDFDLIVYSDTLDKEEYNFVFIDCDDVQIEIITQELKEVNIFPFKDNESLKASVVVYLTKNGLRVSPFIYVGDQRLLSKCNPNYSNQKKLKFMYQIQFGKVTPLDLLDYLSFVIQEKASTENEISSHLSTKRKSPQKEHPLSFEEAKNLTLLKEKMKQLSIDGVDVLSAMKRYHTTNKEKNLVRELENGSIYPDDIEELYQDKKTHNIQVKSERQYLNLKAQVLKHLNNHIKQYKVEIDQNSNDDDSHLVTLFDVSTFLFKYSALLESSTQMVNIGIDEEAIKSKIINEKGVIYNNDSFSSLSIQLIGHFLLYLDTHKIVDNDEAFSELEFSKLKRDCYSMILFGIIHHMQFDNFYKIETLGTIYYKINQHLEVVSIDDLLEYFNMIKYEFDTSPDYHACIEILDKKKLEIEEELEKDINNANYFKTKRLGVCRIYQKLPEHDPKSLKFYYPGFNYIHTKRKFIYPYIYNIDKQKWYLSKQDLQD